MMFNIVRQFAHNPSGFSPSLRAASSQDKRNVPNGIQSYKTTFLQNVYLFLPYYIEIKSLKGKFKFDRFLNLVNKAEAWPGAP